MIFSSQNLPIIMMVVDVAKNSKTYKEPHVIMRFFLFYKNSFNPHSFSHSFVENGLLDYNIKNNKNENTHSNLHHGNTYFIFL